MASVAQLLVEPHRGQGNRTVIDRIGGIAGVIGGGVEGGIDLVVLAGIDVLEGPGGRIAAVARRRVAAVALVAVAARPTEPAAARLGVGGVGVIDHAGGRGDGRDLDQHDGVGHHLAVGRIGHLHAQVAVGPIRAEAFEVLAGQGRLGRRELLVELHRGQSRGIVIDCVGNVGTVIGGTVPGGIDLIALGRIEGAEGPLRRRVAVAGRMVAAVAAVEIQAIPGLPVAARFAIGRVLIADDLVRQPGETDRKQPPLLQRIDLEPSRACARGPRRASSKSRISVGSTSPKDCAAWA